MSMNLCVYVTFPHGFRTEVHDGLFGHGLWQTPTKVTYRILGVSQAAFKRASAEEYDALLATKVTGMQPCFDRYAKWRQEQSRQRLAVERTGWRPDSDDPEMPQTWEGYAEVVALWHAEALDRLRKDLENAALDGATITWEAH